MAILYAAQGTNVTTSSLYTLDSTTGAVASTIGPIGYALTGLAFDPTSGTLYGVTSNNSAASPNKLITVNISTGVGTLVGAGSPNSADITFTSDGQMWGVTGGGILVQVDKATGGHTNIGGFNLYGCFDSTANDLFLFQDGIFDGSDIYLVAQDGSKTLLVNTNGINSGSTSAANAGSFGPDGKFYISNARSIGTARLITSNWLTGLQTSLGTSLSKMDALAWDTQSKPTITGPAPPTPPPNDDFVNAEIIAGTSGSTAGTTVNATSQVGEPIDSVHSPSGPFHTVWYKRIATTNRALQIAIDGTWDVEVFTGSSVNSLTLIAGKPIDAGNGLQLHYLILSQLPGQTYYIRVQNANVDGTFTLSWIECTATPPVNDAFSSAITIPGTGNGNIIQQQQCATVELAEPGLKSGANFNSGNQIYFFTTWRKITLTASTSTLRIKVNTAPNTLENVGGVVELYRGLTTLTSISRVGYGSQGSDQTFALTAGTYYLQFVSATWGASSFNVDYWISSSTDVAPADFSVSTVGTYTRFDIFPNGALSLGIWVRFLLHRASGDKIRIGACASDLGGTDDLVFMRLVASDGTTVLTDSRLRGYITGMNEVIGGLTFIDGVQVSTNTERFMGGAPRSQDTMLCETYLTGATSFRYLDLGMISGPSCLTGWTLDFSSIRITDDPRVGPLGSPDSSSKDVGYFAGWTDVDVHLPVVVGTLPTATAAPPAGGPSYALDCTVAASRKSVDVPIYGYQHKFSASFSFCFTAWPNNYTDIAYISGPSSQKFCEVYVDDTGLMSHSNGSNIATLQLGVWYDVELIVNREPLSYISETVVVNGGAVGVSIGTHGASTIVNYPFVISHFYVGSLGTSFGPFTTTCSLFIGPIATGRTRKSVPIGTVTVEKLPITTEGTHLLPDMNPAGQIRDFATYSEIIYGGTPITTNNWSGKNSDAEGGGVIAGGNINDLTTSGNPTATGTVTVGGSNIEGWLRMMDYFAWPQGTMVWFDFYVQGPVGNTARMADIGRFAENYDAQFAGIVCDGSRQHVTGWSVVLSETASASIAATFNMYFGGVGTYTIDTFRAYISPFILPIYATSDASGAGSSLVTLADGISASKINDNSDATVVMLDRLGTGTYVSIMGDYYLAGLFAVLTFLREASQWATHYYLEYQVADPIISPDGVKVLARTGGYLNLSATRVSGQSRFGIDTNSGGKSIGSLTASAITGGELLIPEPTNPSTRWTNAKLQEALLRMGYYDHYQTDTPSFAAIGMHAIGNKPTRDYPESPGGGVVAYAHLEAVKLTPGWGPVSFSHIRSNVTRGPLSIR